MVHWIILVLTNHPTTFLSDVIICQSIVRQCLSVKKAAVLRHKRRLAAALLIDTRQRGFVVRRRFVKTKARVTIVQSVFRRWRAVREYAREQKAAVAISAAWRGYSQHIEYRRTFRGMKYIVWVVSSLF
jgi:hypothetical protein